MNSKEPILEVDIDKQFGQDESKDIKKLHAFLKDFLNSEISIEKLLLRSYMVFSYNGHVIEALETVFKKGIYQMKNGNEFYPLLNDFEAAVKQVKSVKNILESLVGLCADFNNGENDETDL